nr:hypothetical protein [Tanacetum cinerariifolium]
ICLCRVRKTIRLEPSMLASMEACIVRHAAALLPSLHVLSPPLGYRATEIRMRALLPSTSRRTDIPKADMPLRKMAFLTTPTLGFEVGESSAAGAAYAGTKDRSASIAAHVRILEAQVATLIAQTSSLQTQLTTALGCIEILEARDPEPQEGTAEASSRCVAAALAERDADRSKNGDNSNDSGTGVRRQVPTQQECTYTNFLKCQPKNFKGTEGVVGLTQWIEKMEFVFHISNCTIASHVKPACYCNENTNNNNNNNNNNQRAQGENPRNITCFECGVQGHFRSDCPKLRNGNQGNRTGNGNAVERAYVVGTVGTNPNSNVVTGTFLLNNRYDSILFDIGADRSFISTAFNSLIDIIPTTLDHGYDVDIDLMPIEMGSFEVIIGMD